MVLQFKRILSLVLALLVLVSTMVSPAYAADEVYNVTDDTSALSVPIYYTPDYYPGAVAEMRSSGLFANRIAHGSYSELNYNPSWFYKSGSSYPSGDFSSITPDVVADQSDVSAVYTIPNTTLLNGSLLSFRLPSTDDCYFDFQSSNFLFDQQSPQANTFYINGDLTFSLRNLWSFNGSDSSGAAKNASWYLASDPLAVQLVIDGKAYGDIIDVASYSSPFTALYNGGVPTNATVTFNNLKVYYQGDTPEFIGFRVFTGSAFTDGQYTYGDFIALEVTNTITFRCSEMPDITFVQEGGDGYAGDLSGISGLLSGISGKLADIFSSVSSNLTLLVNYFTSAAGDNILNYNGSVLILDQPRTFSYVFNRAMRGLRALMVDSSGFSYLQSTYLQVDGIRNYLRTSGGISWLQTIYSDWFPYFVAFKNAMDAEVSYSQNTVFPWQSYNMETHQLNAATNITGQNNLFFTAFQSMEDKLGRLAYVFGSDEDLQLKDEADPGTDAFRENFGGGLSLGQISDGADVVEGVNGLFDSGYSFGDAFTEISGESMFTMWFSAENAAAIDSTGSVMVLDDSDPYNMQIYYDRLQKVAEKRDWGLD